MQRAAALRSAVPRLAVAILLGLGACTTTTVQPGYVQPAPEKVESVAIGDITTDEQSWAPFLPHLRRGLLARLEKSGAFAEVMETAPDRLPPETVLIAGKLTEIEEGSEALRFLVGFGAGRARARGLFHVFDSSGQALAVLQSSKAYAGGTGLGGLPDFLDMEDLVQELGEETAASVIRWSRGETLEPPKKQRQ